MPEVFYKTCDECGHEYEIVTTEETLLADGYAPVSADEDGYVFNVWHTNNGTECRAMLVIWRDEI